MWQLEEAHYRDGTELLAVFICVLWFPTSIWLVLPLSMEPHSLPLSMQPVVMNGTRAPHGYGDCPWRRPLEWAPTTRCPGQAVAPPPSHLLRTLGFPSTRQLASARRAQLLTCGGQLGPRRERSEVEMATQKRERRAMKERREGIMEGLCYKIIPNILFWLYSNTLISDLITLKAFLKQTWGGQETGFYWEL